MLGPNKERPVRTICFLLSFAATASAEVPIIHAGKPNAFTFEAEKARFVRLVIQQSSGGQPCIDELEVYGADGEANLALVSHGATASASSCLPGYAIHRIGHLNDGRYGNSHSWIAAAATGEWAQIELPKAVKVSKVVLSRDREGRFGDRVPVHFDIRISLDGKRWKVVRIVKAASPRPQPVAQRGPTPWSDFAIPTPSAVGLLDTSQPTVAEALRRREWLRYAFLCEARTAAKIDPSDPTARVLKQFSAMIDRFAAAGLDVSAERSTLSQLAGRQELLAPKEPPDVAAATVIGWQEPLAPKDPADVAAATELFFAARRAKRRLFFRSPDLEAIKRVLFVKRQPFLPSHNYSVILDARGAAGGAVCVLKTPWRDGRLWPDRAKVARLFEAANGVARDPMADFAAKRIYFGYRKTKSDYFRILAMDADGGNVKQLTDGPFHDYYPCPLPDGGIAFMSTRCKARFLCWRPQAFVLFRMGADGGDIRPLSHANISEWTPGMMRDGRIIWMRSEYLDKGANFGHTLWAIRPDGTHPELVFGNNTRNCYANGREVPGTSEIACTLVSHGGDLNGPIALIDLSKGRFDPTAIQRITPDVPAQYHMSWIRKECFRDPVPISRDYFLVSHAPDDRFGLYVIDRYGNRELLHLDPAIGSMCPTLLRPTPTPPVFAAVMPDRPAAAAGLGQFAIADVYHGLAPSVKRRQVKYIRVCGEVRSDLRRLPSGGYQADHVSFQDWYATPIHKVSGPHGWPSYVAKASYGLATVEPDGSANFYAPAGKVLYFEALDEDFNELQRMRSVLQLQPGEKRSCIGCHESRGSAPPVRRGIALRRGPQRLQPPPWGAGPFSYERVVQPVWDAKCVSCHNTKHKRKLDLTGALDAARVPASYRTLIEQGWVHYFNWQYGVEHTKAAPRSFGTLKSKLWKTLDAGHNDVKLTAEQMRRIKCWIDLNCPLWPDYTFRLDRPKTPIAAAP